MEVSTPHVGDLLFREVDGVSKRYRFLGVLFVVPTAGTAGRRTRSVVVHEVYTPPPRRARKRNGQASEPQLKAPPQCEFWEWSWFYSELQSGAVVVEAFDVNPPARPDEREAARVLFETWRDKELSAEDRKKLSPDQQYRLRLLPALEAFQAAREAILRPDTRLRSMRQVMALTGLDLKTLKRALFRLLDVGWDVFSFSSNFGRCGGAGKERFNYVKKAGRPPTALDSDATAQVDANDAAEPKTLDEYTRALIRRFVLMQLRKRQTLNTAWEKFNSKRKFELVAGQQPGMFKVAPAQQRQPHVTREQFRYYGEQMMTQERRLRLKHSDKNFELTYRPHFTGRDGSDLQVGSIGQIDCLTTNFVVASTHNRQQSAGTLTGYLYIDYQSQYILGFEVSTHPPCFEGVINTLVNAASDKVQFVAELSRRTGFGLELQPEDWRCQHLTASILADKGSNFFGDLSSRMPMILGPNAMANTPAKKPDLKGLIEGTVGLLKHGLGKEVPHGRKGKKVEYDDPDPDEFALFTLDELRLAMAIVIMERNASIQRQTLPELVRDGIPATANAMWDHAIETGQNQLLRKSPEYIQLTLLPRMDASIVDGALTIGDELFYAPPPEILASVWYSDLRLAYATPFANKKSTPPLKVAMDRELVNYVFLECPQVPSGYVRCTLALKSQKFMDLSLAEVQAIREDARVANKSAVPNRELQVARRVLVMDHVRAAAEAEKARTADPDASKAALKRGKVTARDRIRQQEKMSLGNVLATRGDGESEQARVPINVTPELNSFAYPEDSDDDTEDDAAGDGEAAVATNTNEPNQEPA